MMSAASRPHHWTGSIYSRFSVVTIPSPRWLLGKYIHFLWRGNVCVAIMIKRGIVHALCWPLSCWQHRSVVIPAAKTLQSFPPAPDWLLPAWSLHYGDIMAGADHGDHWWWWYIRDMSRHPEWWSLPRDAISHHTPTTFLTPSAPHRPSLSQKYSPAILQTIVVWQGWELQNAFNFWTFPIAFVILALAVKITTGFMSKRLLWFSFSL